MCVYVSRLKYHASNVVERLRRAIRLCDDPRHIATRERGENCERVAGGLRLFTRSRKRSRNTVDDLCASASIHRVGPAVIAPYLPHVFLAYIQLCRNPRAAAGSRDESRRERASEQAREEMMASTTEEDEEVAKGKTGGGGIARGVQLTSNRTLHRDARS